MTISGLSTDTPLDRELRDSYSLTVTVNDQLRSVIHSFAVQITDVNDVTPKFEMDTYILTNNVLEDSTDGMHSLIYFNLFRTSNYCCNFQ